ncbi:ABC transporter permease [Streptomyces sp. CC208A]|uniref:ABC transporter permease n=1 Tax=Streptomyces sp. CC208A TaxID=3044573 RepID=UPI0024A8C57F|nr:ABC transporter permease [Streptomyces sp. CC208A]
MSLPVARATAWRTWQTTRRAYPWTYAVGTVLPAALAIALASFAYHSIGGGTVAADFTEDTGTTAYLAYLTVGAVAFQFTVRLILWAAKALITEMREGTLGALFIAPAGRFPYLAGFTAFAVAGSLVEFLALGAVVAAFGIAIPVSSPAGVLLGTAALIGTVFAFSVGLGGLMIAAGEAHISQNTVFVVLGLLGGFTFPRTYLPEWAQWCAELLPTTAAVDVLHGATTGGQSLADLLPRLGTCVLVAAAYLLLGLLYLPRAEARAAERTY